MGQVHPSCKGAHQLLSRSQSNTYVFQYFTKYKQKSLDSYDFKSTVIEFFASDSAAAKSLDELDWDSWFYKPGFPPKPNFDTSLVDVCYQLADRWEALAKADDKDGFEPKTSDIAGWTANQVVVFLEKAQDFARLLKRDDVELMGERYGFATSQNVEVVSRYFRVGLRAKDPGVYGPTAELLGRVGRMKFVRPL